MSHNANTMITARLAPDFEKRVGEIAARLSLSASDLVRIGLNRIIEEFDSTGSVAVRPADSDPPATDEEAS